MRRGPNNGTQRIFGFPGYPMVRSDMHRLDRDVEITEAIFELHQETLGSFFAYTLNPGQQRHVLGPYGLCQCLERQSGNDSDSKLGANAVDTNQVTEHVPRQAGTKAVKQLRIFPDHEVSEQHHIRPWIGRGSECFAPPAGRQVGFRRSLGQWSAARSPPPLRSTLR